MNIKEKPFGTFIFLIGFIFILFVYGSIPFFHLPTLGQAVWTSGFAQSLANQNWYSVYADNFGYPDLAPVNFGLSGVIVIATLLRFGMQPPDAYALMCALYLFFAYLGAYLLSRSFGVNRTNATLSSVLWGTMPIIWTHSGYSMLSLGIAMLPLYFFSVQSLFNKTKFGLPLFMVYFIICIVAIFMDGYSFMMFVLSTALFLVYRVFFKMKPFLIQSFFVIQVLAPLLIAYCLYSVYIGRAYFEPSNLEFFRAWGLDIDFFLRPTKGVFWLWDTLKISIPRDSHEYFGDASVWTSSFGLPVYSIGVFSWLYLRNKKKETILFFLFAFIAFYLALGPSFKFNSVKSADMGALMPEQYAVFPTGTAFLSLFVPGFNNMRAAYRWLSLGVFGSWCLTMLLIGNIQNEKKYLCKLVILTLIIVNMPNLQYINEVSQKNRENFFKIKSELAMSLSDHLNSGELVVFLPYDNDFIVNYIASLLNIRTYNVGGDKNLFAARMKWPSIMKKFKMASLDSDFTRRVVLFLLQENAEVVVIPRIHLLWAAHFWPPQKRFEKEYPGVIKALRQKPFLHIVEESYYAIVKISEPLLSKASRLNLIQQVENSIEKAFFDSSTLTKVGIVEDGNLSSRGQSGLLLYGPYQPLRAGRYRVSLWGKFSLSNESWVDIASESGKKIHMRSKLKDLTNNQSTLFSFELSIEDTKDLELRLFVSEEDVITLEGYNIFPIDD